MAGYPTFTQNFLNLGIQVLESQLDAEEIMTIAERDAVNRRQYKVRKRTKKKGIL